MAAPLLENVPLATLILAAGASRRLGQPKQLVLHRGRTLLEHTLDAALTAGATPITVVLGAHADVIRSQVSPLPAGVTFFEHTGWAEGMGTSIAFGLKSLLSDHPNTTGVLILVCDQPALDATLLNRFMKEATANLNSILVADYGSERGPPVLFPQSCFADLLALRGDSGAKKILQNRRERLQLITFPKGEIDLDTPDDLARHES